MYEGSIKANVQPKNISRTITQTIVKLFWDRAYLIATPFFKVSNIMKANHYELRVES